MFKLGNIAEYVVQVDIYPQATNREYDHSKTYSYVELLVIATMVSPSVSTARTYQTSRVDTFLRHEWAIR